MSTVVELREIMKDVGEKVVFVCDDDELMKAGKRENLEVINPRNEVDRQKLIEMLR